MQPGSVHTADATLPSSMLTIYAPAVDVLNVAMAILPPISFRDGKPVNAFFCFGHILPLLELDEVGVKAVTGLHLAKIDLAHIDLHLVADGSVDRLVFTVDHRVHASLR